MKKLLFFDYRELEYVEGFARAVEPPVKHPGAPLMTPDLPWEHGNMQLYGSVIQAADGQFRAWYEVCVPPFTHAAGLRGERRWADLGASRSWTRSARTGGGRILCSTRSRPVRPCSRTGRTRGRTGGTRC